MIHDISIFAHSPFTCSLRVRRACGHRFLLKTQPETSLLRCSHHTIAPLTTARKMRRKNKKATTQPTVFDFKKSASFGCTKASKRIVPRLVRIIPVWHARLHDKKEAPADAEASLTLFTQSFLNTSAIERKPSFIATPRGLYSGLMSDTLPVLVML